jgi:CHASE3 domain sensor protein
MTKVRTDHQITFESSLGNSATPPRARGPFGILGPSSSLRRRVAYSLAVVRLILVPIIFLAIYYLFEMGWIVDRIVNRDAPSSSLAEQASIGMLEARRAERNYFLLRDPSYLQTNHESISKVSQILHEISDLQPQEQDSTIKALDDLTVYEQRFAAAASEMNQPGQAPADRIQAVVRAYEKDLNDLLKGTKFSKREHLIEELRRRVESFDTQITNTVQAGNPALEKISSDLQLASQNLLSLTSEMETRSWNRVQADHQEARHLIHQAEWALGTVSVLTFLFSVWVSFILPRQVVSPLVRLKEAVDRVAAGQEGMELEVSGTGEITQLAASIQRMVMRLRHTG